MEWEVKLLCNIISEISFCPKSLTYQLEEGLLVRKFPDNHVFRNYVGFSYNPLLSKKYENRKAETFIVKGVKVFDRFTKNFIDFWIFISGELIMGYSTPNNANFDADLDKIDFGKPYKERFGDDEFKTISKLFTKEEKSLFNPSDVYAVELDGKIFYHILDIGDGDFISIDIAKRVYKITHDPYEIDLLSETLSVVLSRKW